MKGIELLARTGNLFLPNKGLLHQDWSKVKEYEAAQDFRNERLLNGEKHITEEIGPLEMEESWDVKSTEEEILPEEMPIPLNKVLKEERKKSKAQ